MSYSMTALKLTTAAANSDSGNLDIPAGTAGLHAIVNIATITGTTPSVTVTVEGYDPVSATYYTLLASAALTAAGQTVLKIFPAAAAAANLAANDIIPDTIRVRATIAGTTPAVTATGGLNIIY